MTSITGKALSTSFKKKGTVASAHGSHSLLPAKLSRSKGAWYRVWVNNTAAYVSADYIKLGTSLFIQKSAKELAGKSELARALLTNPSRGGKARVVYTFTPDNCKAFCDQGYKNAKGPSGLYLYRK